MADDLKFDNTLASKLDAGIRARRPTGRRWRAGDSGVWGRRYDSDGRRAKAAEAQHAKGRLTVRERLKLLLDEGTELLELGLWAAYGMYGEYAARPELELLPGLGVYADGFA